jgi:Trypsin.
MFQNENIPKFVLSSKPYTDQSFAQHLYSSPRSIDFANNLSMKKNFLPTLFLVCEIIAVISLGATASAVVGPDNLRSPGGNEATCRILSRNARGKLLGICSGSLVKRNQILTAAHCATPHMATIVAECGYSGIDASLPLTQEVTEMGTRVYTGAAVQFLDNSTGIYTYIDREHDQAVLTLSNQLNITPLRVSSNYQVTPNDNCRIEGFGRTNDSTAGILYRGHLKTIGINPDGKQISDVARVLVQKKPGQVSAHQDIYTLPETSFITNAMDSVVGRRGDSGAPIICYLNGRNIVVAVWAQILKAAPSYPNGVSSDPDNFELALHTSYSRLIQTETLNHIFGK